MPLSPDLCEAIRGKEGVERFFRSQFVQDELTGDLATLRPSSTQRPIHAALRDHRRVAVNKPRQCYASTACAIEGLRQTEYYPGHHGVIITNLSDTSSTLLDRVLTAYRFQDEAIQVPSNRKGRAAIEFKHGGTLKVLTARGDDPGVGSSIDFLHASELGSWPSARETLSKIMPALNKRPHSRVVIESTPGEYGGDWHELWQDSLAGKTGYHPVFIAWWQHKSYRDDASNTVATDEEKELLRLYPGMTLGHVAFRRRVLAADCFGDTRLFDKQYPWDEASGWTGTLTPSLDEAPLRALLADAIPTEGVWGTPLQGHTYMLVADPASFGRTGDPSAWTLWDLHDRIEVGAWSARIDPMLLAKELEKIGRRFNMALVVVESNAAACIAALLRGGYPKVWQDSGSPDQKPGWWATSVDIERSMGALARQLFNGQLRVRSRKGLLQLLDFDGNREKRSGGHHYDRVVTYRIAADMLERLHVPTTREPATFRDANGQIKLSMLRTPNHRPSGL